MPDAKPVILLAFANDREGQFLRNISREYGEIDRVIRETKPDHYECVPFPDVDFRYLVQKLQDYRNRIWIFHYGGHADGELLHFSSKPGEPRQLAGESLAEYFKFQQGVELVFLNGCATYDQAAAFLENGVRYVVVTDRKIEDEAARIFSAAFYRSLLTGIPVRQAVEEAALKVKYEKGNATRALYWDTQEEPSGFPWKVLPEVELNQRSNDLIARQDEIYELMAGDDLDYALARCQDFVKDFAPDDRRALRRVTTLKGEIRRRGDDLDARLTLIDQILELIDNISMGNAQAA